MQWHDCYYHFWSAVLLNEGCCQASCMGMIILRGICGLVPPGWMWWMGRKWWCLKHSQVLPDPSHSIITVTQFDWAQIQVRWFVCFKMRLKICSPTTPMPSINRFIELNLLMSINKNYPRLFFVLLVLVAFVPNFIWMCDYTMWEMCCVDTLFAIWSHYMLPNVFDMPVFLDP